MNRREFFRASGIVAATAIVSGPAALDAFERLSWKRKYFAGWRASEPTHPIWRVVTTDMFTRRQSTRLLQAGDNVSLTGQFEDMFAASSRLAIGVKVLGPSIVHVNGVEFGEVDRFDMPNRTLHVVSYVGERASPVTMSMYLPSCTNEALLAALGGRT